MCGCAPSPLCGIFRRGIFPDFRAPGVAVGAWSAALTTGMEQAVRELPQCLLPLSRVHRMRPPVVLGGKCDWQTGRSAPHASVRRSGQGDPRLAAALSGRAHSLEGCVVAGRHLGHRLGFPTANLYFPAGRLIPAHGVYATRVYTPDGVFPGVSNVGVRPTVDGSAHPRPRNCETSMRSVFPATCTGGASGLISWNTCDRSRNFPIWTHCAPPSRGTRNGRRSWCCLNDSRDGGGPVRRWLCVLLCILLCLPVSVGLFLQPAGAVEPAGCLRCACRLPCLSGQRAGAV